MGRVALIVAVSGVILVASLHAGNDTAARGIPDVASERKRANDPLTQELVRCHRIGPAAKDDSACALAWAENRRRFFQVTPPSPPPAEAK